MQGAAVPHRVVVTGLGVVTPIGATVSEFWDGCKRARLGITPLDGFDLGDLKILIGAQIRDFDPKARLKHFQRDKIILHADRYSWFAAAAADEAIKQSGLEVPFKDAYRVACIVGSGAGGGIEAVADVILADADRMRGRRAGAAGGECGTFYAELDTDVGGCG